MSSETLNVRLRILLKENENSTFSVRDIPLMSCVTELNEYFLNNYKDDLVTAADNSFKIGYFGERYQKFTIQSSIQLMWNNLCTGKC